MLTSRGWQHCTNFFPEPQMHKALFSVSLGVGDIVENQSFDSFGIGAGEKTVLRRYQVQKRKCFVVFTRSEQSLLFGSKFQTSLAS